MINPHAKHPIYLQWLAIWSKDKIWLKAERGRQAELAKALGVSRQTVSRWMLSYCRVPAWGYWATHQWVSQQIKKSKTIDNSEVSV
jgi:hypothetical protein